MSVRKLTDQYHC